VADDDPALSVQGVTLQFPGTDAPALDDVSVSVDEGEVVALLGPSGCGKTTLLRVVAGLVRPDAGRVLLGGRDQDGVPTHRRGIGLMFQDYALFPHRDVGGNVEFGLRMAGMARSRRASRVAEVLDLVGLGGWEQRPVGPLSGGERQRVALARALAPAPRLLLLDEPLGALDRTLRDRLVPELGELFRSVGVSVVHVTHDQSEALALADRIIVMDHGVVVQEATPDELWARPASELVARFLGFTNVVPAGAVGSDHRGLVLVRAEAVTLTRPGEGHGTTERGEPATVAIVVYRGDHSVVTVHRSADGLELEATVPTGEQRWRVGDAVLVSVDPEGVQPL
jgi:thiamine transport system ATP-binding protein